MELGEELESTITPFGQYFQLSMTECQLKSLLIFHGRPFLKIW